MTAYACRGRHDMRAEHAVRVRLWPLGLRREAQTRMLGRQPDGSDPIPCPPPLCAVCYSDATDAELRALLAAWYPGR